MSLPVDEPLIYLITKGEATPANFEKSRLEIFEIIGFAVEEKVSLIQIREKQLSARLLFELTGEAVKITCGSSTRLLVNDRTDIAVAAKADGVHLAANSIPARVIRRKVPKGFVIGVSTHTLESARNAAGQGADFIVFGPVFESSGKGEPQGLGKLAEVCSELRPFPVIGLGGIDETNYSSALEAGANGIAAIRFLNDPAKMSAAARDLRKQIK